MQLCNIIIDYNRVLQVECNIYIFMVTQTESVILS